MSIKKSLIASSIALTVLVGCGSDNDDKIITTYDSAVFATYNLSFDRSSYEQLVAEMTLPVASQNSLVEQYINDRDNMTDEDAETAESVMQIRNVAEIIQRTRPNAFVLAEFNNDGNADDMTALEGFQNNYLSHSQGEQETIHYGYMKNVATNTGLASGFDLNRDGEATGINDDAWGYGAYHGQYAFAVFSQFEIDENNVRTFQNFKWKDMDGEINIKVQDCGDNGCPDGLEVGDAWYSEEAWEQFPLSSKNHADIPVLIPTEDGVETIHFLVSHPAPPIFDNQANHNTERNRAEIKFWNDYINSETYFYDDNNTEGGLAAGSKFVIAGDLNADHMMGDGDRDTIKALLEHSLVNINATTGDSAPESNGGQYCFDAGICERNTDTPQPERITSVSGLRLDYAIPSENLEVIESGTFWPAGDEDGYHLVFDEELGNSKGVSSDHRMVWTKVSLND